MTSQSPFGRRAAQGFPALPKGETVASFETYEAAQAAVDKLAKAEFPVNELAIVGTDLTSVERITGKLTWSRAAGAGAISGAWFGTFLGLLFFIFSPTGAGIGILASAVLIGAGFGVIAGLVSYSVNRRRRDFTSVMQVLATRYAIIADTAHVARARNVLGVDASAAEQAVGSSARAESSAPDVTAAAASSAPAEQPATAAPEPTGPQLTYGEAQDAARRARNEAAAAARARPSVRSTASMRPRRVRSRRMIRAHRMPRMRRSPPGTPRAVAENPSPGHPRLIHGRSADSRYIVTRMSAHDGLEGRIDAEIAAGERRDRPIRRALRGIRRRIDRHPRLRTVYRAAVGVLGGVIAVGGLALVPLPGPGWLVVFLGLAILGTEFAWARRAAASLKRMLAKFWAWWQARRAARRAAGTA
ncbi:TIGR02611 family protein [Agromyces protaetiae]|uniref:TIGR02611 family protein n=1 Tax=Agromyces protaetiae TaxID=2509455 RepID=UPI0013ECDA56|nr:TIGR02611 family protein [Agromyces protaetiae]